MVAWSILALLLLALSSAAASQITTTKECYRVSEEIIVKFSLEEDEAFGAWIGVFPAGQRDASNSAPLLWLATCGRQGGCNSFPTNGTVTFGLDSPAESGVASFPLVPGYFKAVAAAGGSVPATTFATSNAFQIAATGENCTIIQPTKPLTNETDSDISSSNSIAPTTPWANTTAPNVSPVPSPISPSSNTTSSAAANVSTDSLCYSIEQEINVSFSGVTIPRVWVGIYEARDDISSSEPLLWLYTCGQQFGCQNTTSEGSLSFGFGEPRESWRASFPLDTGYYRAALVTGDSLPYNYVGSSGVFSIYGSEATCGLKSIVERLADLGRFDSLVGAMDRSGLNTSLISGGPYTLFAPGDSAFAALGDTITNKILNDSDLLSIVLSYHVVPGEFFTSSITAGEYATLEGDVLEVSIQPSGVITLNQDADVVRANRVVSNGVIHEINKVLFPPQVNLTALISVEATNATNGPTNNTESGANVTTSPVTENTSHPSAAPSGNQTEKFILYLNKTCFVKGEGIMVTFDVTMPSSLLWIGIYTTQHDIYNRLSEPLLWLYTCGSQECDGYYSLGSMTFGYGVPTESGIFQFPLPIGQYVSVLAAGTEQPYQLLAVSSNFTVTNSTCL